MQCVGHTIRASLPASLFVDVISKALLGRGYPSIRRRPESSWRIGAFTEAALEICLEIGLALLLRLRSLLGPAPKKTNSLGLTGDCLPRLSSVVEIRCYSESFLKYRHPNIPIVEYIRLVEERARRAWLRCIHGGKRYVGQDTKGILIVRPTVSSLNNDEIDFRILFDESDDEDSTVIFDKNSFSHKIIFVNNLKTDLENDIDNVNMSLLPSPKHTVSYFDDLDFFKDFENEFPAIVYNDAQTSKSDLLTEPILNPQHIDEFNLKDETSLSKCDEEEQNVLNFNDLFPFNVIYPDDSKTDKDNNNDKIDNEHSLGDLSVKPLPDLINTDVGAYEHGWLIWRIQTPWIRCIDLLDVIQSLFFSTVYTAYSLNEYSVFDTSINTAYPGDLVKNIDKYWWRIYIRDLEVLELPPSSLKLSRYGLFNTQS
ncbi:hypothetical protein Tco_0189617 [Tanacetum coccineum]